MQNNVYAQDIVEKSNLFNFSIINHLLFCYLEAYNYFKNFPKYKAEIFRNLIKLNRKLYIKLV